MLHKSRFRSLVLLPLALLIRPVDAATLKVDAAGGTPYQTIQSAINAAFPLIDDVFVHCGTYNENITVNAGVDVIGEGSDCTIIDGGQNGSVVQMIGIGTPTVLQGFTITNGKSGGGGGIYIEAGSPTITRNVIIGNHAEDVGGLTGCGGGILIVPTFLAAQAPAAPVISANVIRDNVADRFGGGIEIYADDGTVIVNNLIENNTAVQAGGGIDVFASFPSIVNNTIVRNCLQGGDPACVLGGGGVSFDSSGVSDIANNVIAWNEAEAGAGGVDLVGSTVNFTANDSFENLPMNYLGAPDPTGSAGNISIRPAFVDQVPGWLGYQPRSDSPLVDAASDALAPGGDLRGLGRPLDGDVDGTATSDIGARENEGATKLGFVDATTLGWDVSVNSLALFNLYRGDMQELRDTGIYTQDPASVPEAKRFCALGTPTVVDLDEPDPDHVYFYLAVLIDAVEGTLGFDSDAAERPFTDANRCP